MCIYISLSLCVCVCACVCACVCVCNIKVDVEHGTRNQSSHFGKVVGPADSVTLAGWLGQP